MRRPLLLITSVQRQARVQLRLQEVGGRGNPEEQPRRRRPQDHKDLELSLYRKINRINYSKITIHNE
jgi:hypothetical protein